MYMLISTFASGFSLIGNLNGNVLTVMNRHLICTACQLSVDQTHGPENTPDTLRAQKPDTVWGIKMAGGRLSYSHLKVTEASGYRAKLIRHFVTVGFHPTRDGPSRQRPQIKVFPGLSNIPVICHTCYVSFGLCHLLFSDPSCRSTQYCLKSSRSQEVEPAPLPAVKWTPCHWNACFFS